MKRLSGDKRKWEIYECILKADAASSPIKCVSQTFFII